MNSFNQQNSAFDSAVQDYTRGRSTIAQQYLQGKEQVSGATEQATATIDSGKASLENAKAASIPTMALDHLGINVSTKMSAVPAFSAIQKGMGAFSRGARSTSNWVRQTGRQMNNDPLKQSFNRDTPGGTQTTDNPLFERPSAPGDDPATVLKGSTKPSAEPEQPASTSKPLEAVDDDDALDDIFPESSAGESAMPGSSMADDFTGTPNIDIFSSVRPPPASSAPAPASQGAPGAPGEAAAPPPQALADLPGGRASPAPEQATEEPAAPEPTQAAEEFSEESDRNPLQSEATMEDSGGSLMTDEQSAAHFDVATSTEEAGVKGLEEGAEGASADALEATGGALSEGLAAFAGGAADLGAGALAGLAAIAPLVGPIAALVGLGEGIKNLVDYGDNEDSENKKYATAQTALSKGQNEIDTMSTDISSDQFASQIGTNIPRFGSLAAPTFDTSQAGPMGATHF